jgi:predicted ATP-dependent serine protease
MTSTAAAEQRTATGIAGLDQVLDGGFPAHRFYLIQGDPGVGKTTLALQFLRCGVQAGERCLYITLSEMLSAPALRADSDRPRRNRGEFGTESRSAGLDIPVNALRSARRPFLGRLLGGPGYVRRI